MGAWGLDSFENDDAMDWVGDLQDAADNTLLMTTLSAVTNGGYLESPNCCMALAAAEVVAALAERPAANLPEEVGAWVASHKESLTEDLRVAAVSAVSNVRSASELKDLWEESDSLAEWEKLVANLQARLKDEPA